MSWSEAWPMVVPAAAVACLFMAGLWLVQLRTRNAGIVDFGWAVVLGSLALFYAVKGPGWEVRRGLTAAVGGLWGYRLALHLWRGRVWKQPEEGRYMTLRRQWASPLDLSFLVFFEAQAVLAVILSLPFLLAVFNRTPDWMWSDVLGMLVWTVGWVGESIADRQLEKWKADPSNRGRTCRRGLWKFSRHPNYFFEWIIWCGFAVLASGTPGGWIAFLSPLALLVLILRVTGIPPTEAQALKSRGEDYRKYQRTTSAFFPWFPRKEMST